MMRYCWVSKVGHRLGRWRSQFGYSGARAVVMNGCLLWASATDISETQTLGLPGQGLKLFLQKIKVGLEKHRRGMNLEDQTQEKNIQEKCLYPTFEGNRHFSFPLPYNNSSEGNFFHYAVHRLCVWICCYLAVCMTVVQDAEFY